MKNPSPQDIVKKLNSKDFKLGDVVYNQRFLNTLTKKMLEALQSLHSNGIAHHDIKADNIVVTSQINSSGEVLDISAKLIDIDLLQPTTIATSLNQVKGFIPFMPPEAATPEFDGSISYQGKGGDAYAMGMTLRHLAGYSLPEIFALSEKLKMEIAYNRTTELLGDRLENRQLKKAYLKSITHEFKNKNINLSEAEFLRVIESLRTELVEEFRSKPALEADNEIQKRIFLNAKEKTDNRRLKEHGEAVKKGTKNSEFITINTIKDISDRLVKEWHKRDTIEEALGRDLFKLPGNLLPDGEFKSHMNRILRYANIMGQHSKSIDKFNGKIKNTAETSDSDSDATVGVDLDLELPTQGLSTMRKITRLGLAQRRGVKIDADDPSGLSEFETQRVEISEFGQQVNAGGRRAVRNVGNALRNSMAGLGIVSKQSKADLKRNYK